MQSSIASAVNVRVAIAGEPAARLVLGGAGDIGSPAVTAHTFSIWSEYDAAVLEDWDGFDLRLSFYSNGHTARTFVEIGTGAAGSEVVIATFVAGQTASYQQFHGKFHCPIFIPRGSRLAVRWKINLAWPATERPVLQASMVGRRCTEVRRCGGHSLLMGADTATTSGTIALPNTYGDFAWRELVAVAPFHVRHVNVSMHATGFGFANLRVVEIGRGAAAAEVGIVQDASNVHYNGVSLAVDIPAGQRVVLCYAQLTNEGVSGFAVAQLFG